MPRLRPDAVSRLPASPYRPRAHRDQTPTLDSGFVRSSRCWRHTAARQESSCRPMQRSCPRLAHATKQRCQICAPANRVRPIIWRRHAQVRPPGASQLMRLAIRQGGRALPSRPRTTDRSMPGVFATRRTRRRASIYPPRTILLRALEEGLATNQRRRHQRRLDTSVHDAHRSETKLSIRRERGRRPARDHCRSSSAEDLRLRWLTLRGRATANANCEIVAHAT